MYKHILKIHGQALAEEQPLPQNASATGNGDPGDYAGTLGGVEVLAVAATDLNLADGATLTVTLEHAGADGDYAPLGELCSFTAEGATIVPRGTVLGRFIPPTDTRAMTRAVIATDDAAATGSLSVFPQYLAR